MTQQHTDEQRSDDRRLTEQRLAEQVATALAAGDASTRLRAALHAGTNPRPEYVEALVRRCAVEPDFYVRDMLTWALTRADREGTVAQVLLELSSEVAQARSQALHTLSKLGEPQTWPAITEALLRDADDEVARAAWRAATGLVPTGSEGALAVVLATQLGRGDRDVRLSLSRAFGQLGDAGMAVLEGARSHADPEVAAHATATLRLIEDPDEGFDAAIEDARRTVALLASPTVS
ncbi:HEAT repeat domain-containing protein [Pseudactinotalea sp.]|uniref:HEAT repeat domain-containing protein n=1 Tax=Pseudactinotalea sp. TaxID=1926260 RepID=UPI003B3BBF80